MKGFHISYKVALSFKTYIFFSKYFFFRIMSSCCFFNWCWRPPSASLSEAVQICHLQSILGNVTDRIHTLQSLRTQNRFAIRCHPLSMQRHTQLCCTAGGWLSVSNKQDSNRSADVSINMTLQSYAWAMRLFWHQHCWERFGLCFVVIS